MAPVLSCGDPPGLPGMVPRSLREGTKHAARGSASIPRSASTRALAGSARHAEIILLHPSIGDSDRQKQQIVIETSIASGGSCGWRSFGKYKCWTEGSRRLIVTKKDGPPCSSRVNAMYRREPGFEQYGIE